MKELDWEEVGWRREIRVVRSKTRNENGSHITKEVTSHCLTRV